MQRSVKLGHCICNPKQGCPCETFKKKDICPCAGERPEQAAENVALTKLVEKAGCASKINQNDLKKVLDGLPELNDPRVLVGTNTCDDAGVYKLDDSTALVQTVDVFTPNVDDAYTFGKIAAANSLSDVYAMGGKPLTALSVICFPIDTVSHRIMAQMLRGGMDQMAEAGVSIIGGHSVNDKDPKFGYAVTGIVSPSNIITNNKAMSGDILILTKPLGVGIISFASQIGMASESAIAEASDSMSKLNKAASEVMAKFDVKCATDVTGFGLLGHLGEMVCQSGVDAEIYCEQIPVFNEVFNYISRGAISGGVERNREHSSKLVQADGISEDMMNLLYDPQTSGGILMSVSKDKAEDVLSMLKLNGVVNAAAIGEITGKSAGSIIIKNDSKQIIKDSEDAEMEDVETSSCCCGQTSVNDDNGLLPGLNGNKSAANVQKNFGTFMNSVYADGAVSSQTKELMAIALSVLAKCEPCVKVHIDEARSIGVSDEKIKEAVWMAISFGGAPVMMFYKKLIEKELS